MDLSQIDVNELARQLRKPEGTLGEEVGKQLAEFNAQPLAFTFACMDVQPADHLLEIGFGPGEGIAEAARLAPDGFVAGIDFSPEMLAMAEQRNHRAIMQEQVELTLGEAVDLPYADESFDKIFAVNVFHFWAHPARELAACRRVLRPGGQIFFYITHPSSWIKGIADTGVFVAYEADEVVQILKDAGFSDVESRSTVAVGEAEGEGFVVIGIRE